jgi:hypothetical protein
MYDTFGIAKPVADDGLEGDADDATDRGERGSS